MKYNKMVRDKIPEIIRSSGRKCKVKYVSNDQAILLLVEKLIEEAKEFRECPSQEELADIHEVVISLVSKMGYRPAKIELIRKEKAKERGGFRKNIVLIEAQQ